MQSAQYIRYFKLLTALLEYLDLILMHSLRIADTTPAEHKLFCMHLCCLTQNSLLFDRFINLWAVIP